MSHSTFASDDRMDMATLPAFSDSDLESVFRCVLRGGAPSTGLEKTIVAETNRQLPNSVTVRTATPRRLLSACRSLIDRIVGNRTDFGYCEPTVAFANREFPTVAVTR